MIKEAIQYLADYWKVLALVSVFKRNKDESKCMRYRGINLRAVVGCFVEAYSRRGMKVNVRPK